MLRRSRTARRRAGHYTACGAGLLALYVAAGSSAALVAAVAAGWAVVGVVSLLVAHRVLMRGGYGLQALRITDQVQVSRVEPGPGRFSRVHLAGMAQTVTYLDGDCRPLATATSTAGTTSTVILVPDDAVASFQDALKAAHTGSYERYVPLADPHRSYTETVTLPEVSYERRPRSETAELP